MRVFARFLCVAAFFCAGGAAAQTAPPPVEAFGRLPAIAAASISPDGTHIALARTDPQGQSSVAIIDIDHPSNAVAFSVPPHEQLRSVDWADDRHVSYLVTRTFRPGEVLPAGFQFIGRPRRVDYARNGVVDIETRRSSVLTPNSDDAWAFFGASLIAPIVGDPGSGRLFTYLRGNPALYRVDLSTGRMGIIPVRGANQQTQGYEIDENGDVLARYDVDAATDHWRLYIYNDGEPRLLMEDVSEFGEPPSVEGLLPDGRLLIHDRSAETGYYGLYVIDRQSGALTPFYARERGDVGGTIRDPWTRRVVGAGWSGDSNNVHYFDADLQAVGERFAALTQGEFGYIVSWSRDRRRFLVYLERGLDGGGYYIFDPATERFHIIDHRYPELQNLNGERQSITYRARDGERVPAYLTYPAAAEHRNLPLVLLVHGGPHARDDFTFDWWASFLASRGYAVLQPNYRGSTGYGRAWEEAGRRQWGGLMQTDTEDGVAALIRAGIVDPNRVCIIGASYGGYAALAGATLTPDRYRCAASIAGVSDLNLWLTRTDQRSGNNDDDFRVKWWRTSIGEDREHLRTVSPANLADRVHIPVLIIHGTDDTVVPIEQSERMRDRLRSAGKDVRYVTLPGDDHWLSDAATRTQMLRELEGFLAQNLNGPRVVVDDSAATVATPH